MCRLLGEMVFVFLKSEGSGYFLKELYILDLINRGLPINTAVVVSNWML